MAVFLTGDTHGELDIAKVEEFAQVAAEAGLTRDDYLIVLGDFGLVWRDPPSEREAARLDWLEEQPWTTLFVDGNHENFDLLDALPVGARYRGRVQDVRPHVTRLMRGETYQIGGHSFFVCGGAHSIDKQWRTPHVSWWPQEVPDDAERARISEAAAQAGRVDYVLTHCPPTGQYERYRSRLAGFWGPDDEYTAWLEEHVEGVVSYKRWFFGHLHMDLPLDEPHACLYNQVFDLDDTGLTLYSSSMGGCPEGGAHQWEQRYVPPPAGERHGSKAWYECSCCGRRIPLWGEGADGA